MAKSPNRLKFSKLGIERLTPPPRREDGSPQYQLWFDTERPGLALRLSSDGGISFFLARTANGRSERIALGRFPGMTAEQARAKAREVEAQIVAMGRDPNQERRERRNALTLGELFHEYRTHHLLARGKMAANGDSYFRDYLSQWSSKPISDISAEMVMALHQEIPRRRRRRAKRVRDRASGALRIEIFETDKNVSEGMANRVVGFLSAMYGWASRTIDPATHRRYFSGPNPAAGIERFSEEASFGRPLMESEMKRFLEAVRRQSPYWRDFFLALAWTGARLANVCAMRWDQLDLAGHVWLIPSGSTKSRRAYRIALPAHLVTLLARREKESQSEWVFEAKSASGHVEEPKKVWYALLKAAHIKNLRMHDLRTTAASWGANVNVGPFVVASQLGHTRPSMTAHYTHVSDAAKKAAADAIAEAMLEKSGFDLATLTASG